MRVIQLIPAAGIWWAHFNKKQESKQVVAWALCEDVEEALGVGPVAAGVNVKGMTLQRAEKKQGVLAMIANEKSGSLIPAVTQPGFSCVTGALR